MTDAAILQQLFAQGNGLFTVSQAAEAGIYRQQLANLVKSGLLDRVEHGLYIRPDGLDDALFWIQQRAKKIVYSHETALYLHKMTSRTPVRYSITVPSSYKASAALKKYCKIYFIKQELIDLGKIEKLSGMGHSVFTYDPERTICDVIRSRSKIDGQIVVEAIKNYINIKDSDFNRLYKYAENFNIVKILHHYLEVLL